MGGIREGWGAEREHAGCGEGGSWGECGDACGGRGWSVGGDLRGSVAEIGGSPTTTCRRKRGAGWVGKSRREESEMYVKTSDFRGRRQW